MEQSKEYFYIIIFTSDLGNTGKNKNTSLATLDESQKREKLTWFLTPQN